MLVCNFSVTSWLLILQILFSMTLAFNVDTNYSVFYSGPSDSFFGYSVAMAKNNDPGKAPTILIGAPKDTYSTTKFVKTGVLYKCKPSPSSCLPSKVNELRKTLLDYTVQNASDAWIGGTIVLNPANTKVLACGHRWKEWSKTDSGKVNVIMRGICYLGGIEGDTYKMLRIIDPQDTNHICLGKAAVFSKSGSEIIIGIPGYKELAGAAVVFDINGDKKEVFKVTSKNNSYTGFSLSLGAFFKDKLEYYVIGAPRYDNMGVVYIVNGQYSLKETLQFKENKLGSYFGASLCVIDVNNDGYDDMLVGAPLYSGRILEGGAVMLYISDGQSLHYTRTIWGMDMERGQFGTAIKDVGDINNDGYHDIVIGAPYENKREGAIYIYNLGPEGFPANFSQRISGQSVSQGQDMKGFGISISQAVDINDDSYPDFLVGSYLSSQVRLLKSRPVLALDISADTGRIDVNNYNCDPLNTKSVCMDLELTVSYQSPNPNLPSKIELDCKLHTEVSSLANNASSSIHRALIKSGSKYVESKAFSLSLSSTSPRKLTFNLLIKDKTDIFNPIGVFLDYKIREGSLTSCSTLCPVLKGNQYKKLIPYNLDCGSDEKCTSDLRLSLAAQNDHILYGKTQTFRVVVNVYNKGESAYNSLALFTFPSFVQYVHVQYDHVPMKNENTECSSDISGNEELVRCSLGNHIPKDHYVKFTLEFTTAGSLQHNISINASVTTKSEEKNPSDNVMDLLIPVKMKADITFNGFSEPNLLHFSKKSSSLQHNFEIYNDGPSPFLEPSISITLPELSEFVRINCDKSTLINCTTIFPLESLNYGKRKLITVVLDVDAEIFKKAKDIKFLKSTAVLTRKYNPLYLDRPDWKKTTEITTNLQTETKPVASWIIIISIFSGLFVLLIVILILWKCGFFKRKKAGDCDPLTEEGKTEQQSEKLQESNENISVPPPPPEEEKMALSEEQDAHEEIQI